MNRSKHIRIVIAIDGTCAVDAINFAGPICRTATGEILAALGGQVYQERDKPEARLRSQDGERQAEGAR